MPQINADIISQLQADIYRLEGFKPTNNPAGDLALGPIQKAFPKGSFPTGAIHEFISADKDDMASVCGFISGLISRMMAHQRMMCWISSDRRLFPPALVQFGIHPEHLIFVDVPTERDVLPVLYEALKCSALTAVVAEVRDLDFTTSRRLQLAVEQSQATGFVVRNSIKKLNTTACVSRWKISSLSSESYEGLPGIGFPKWRVELMRMRNGKTGIWDVQWINEKFTSIQEVSAENASSIYQSKEKQRKAG